MPLDRGQLVRLHIAGSLALPNPFPTVGEVSRDANPIDYKAKADCLGEYVFYVRHECGNGRSVTWCVRSSDVVAFEKKNREHDPSAWAIGPEVVDVVSSEPTKGILYVRENAQILMQSESGMSGLEACGSPFGDKSDLTGPPPGDFTTQKCVYVCCCR